MFATLPNQVTLLEIAAALLAGYNAAQERGDDQFNASLKWKEGTAFLLHFGQPTTLGWVKITLPTTTSAGTPFAEDVWHWENLARQLLLDLANNL